MLQTQEKCKTENVKYGRCAQGCVNACTMLDLFAVKSEHELADLF